jgi:hypothetical protein
MSPKSFASTLGEERGQVLNVDSAEGNFGDNFRGQLTYFCVEDVQVKNKRVCLASCSGAYQGDPRIRNSEFREFRGQLLI